MTYMVIGGSPCTHWSIAQKNSRETTAEGIGWELFLNYKIAVEKVKALAEQNGANFYFLYENNKSAAEPIKEQIRQELGVTVPSLFQADNGVRFTYINSALVSAQNRQRFYVTNFGDIEQPADRGILLKDILENGKAWNEKSYTLDANCYKIGGTYNPQSQHSYSWHMAAEPANVAIGEKSRTIKQQYYKNGIANFITNDGHDATCIAEPVCISERGRLDNGEYQQQFETREDCKTNSLTTVQKDNAVCEPLGITPGGKSFCITATEYKGSNYQHTIEKSVRTMIAERTKQIYTNDFETNYDYKTNKIAYKVENGQITIKGKQYPIKLSDGFYVIRKLTVTECARLQTMPDDYCRTVSASQGYRGLGNGWTAEVIIHLLQHAKIPVDEEITVISMYDGIGTGRHCLDKMGYKNVKYFAYEIDKYAMQIAKSNYPDIVEMGDAFAVRNEDWSLDELKRLYDAG